MDTASTEETTEDISEEDVFTEEDKIYVRLACGKIEVYYGYHTFGDGSKILLDKKGNWRTGPFVNLEELIVDKDTKEYNYVKPYEKDIHGNIFKRSTGELSNCKNCEAYALWTKYGDDIMICTERCLSCIKATYMYNIRRIQRKWRIYKHIDTQFEWDWRQEQYIPIKLFK